jgi:2-polyprenyl-3-methyl-5-hydroxy-6-metoxy-1,4-benzoquinol methylase
MMATTTAAAVPETAVVQEKLDAFLGKFVQDLGAAVHAATVVAGDRLGLYRALSEKPATSAELAKKTGLNERMVREWLRAQAASGYAEYDAATDRYSLTPEQAFALADPNGLSLPGAFFVAESMMRDVDKLETAFRTGSGVGWHEHYHSLFHGTERFFRPNYNRHLVSEWIPALTGVQEKLEKGGTVADVGCGHGASCEIMATAFPKAHVTGFDYHEPSLDVARQHAEEAGLSDRITYKQATAKTFPGKNYDLIAFFDCLHDMGDPVGAAEHARKALAPDGVLMLVEPMAGDATSDNMHEIGRVYYSASTLICVPSSQAQEVGAALGAQAGEAKLREILTQAGFTRIRRAAETPFNLVIEAQP